MKVVLAPDSFKGTLSAPQVCEALAEGLRRAWPTAQIDACPMADGGEGTCSALIAATAGRRVAVAAVDPLQRPIEAEIGVSGDGGCGFVEMAAASGLVLLEQAERDPLRTTTFGTGQLLAAALQTGAGRIILGIGGSGTVDLGAGCLQALGVKFLEEGGNVLPPGLSGGKLTQVAGIDRSALDPRWRTTELLVACDVNNPLLGGQGAAAVYGPQKGADPDAVRLLEANLSHLAAVFHTQAGEDVRRLAGAGAAGGLGAGLHAVCGARLLPGFEVVAQAVQLSKRLRGADLVITGEGRLDAQTSHGKVVAGVARLARQHGVPCVAIAGCVRSERADVLELLAGWTALADEPVDLEQAKRDGRRLLAEAVENLARSWPFPGRVDGDFRRH